MDTNPLLYAVNFDATEHARAHVFLQEAGRSVDVRTVALMREHGVRRIHTADTDFLQFPGIEVVDPLRAQ